MNRLLATMRLDARLQARNKLYHIGLSLAVMLGVAGRGVFAPESLRHVLPVFFLLFIGSSTYMFVAGMILLERGERTLDVLRVTPLGIGEYLGSKVLTLTIFATLECLIILFIAHGTGGFEALPLIVGIVAMSMLYTLLGVGQALPYKTVTDFLIPGALITTLLLQLPLFYVLGVWPSPLWYLIPTLAPLVLIEAAFSPIEPWEWAYAIGYSGAGILVAAWLARARFQRHVIMGGARP